LGGEEGERGGGGKKHKNSLTLTIIRGPAQKRGEKRG